MPEQLDFFDSNNRRPLSAHIWAEEPNGFYVEPSWVPQRLFEVEKFSGSVWDPACGLGRIADAARAAGYPTVASDIIDRGYHRCVTRVADFLQWTQLTADNIVCNPPFALCDQFAQHALQLGVDAVAMIWLARRLNAARWLADTPLATVHLLTPRPSMPPGAVILAGETPGGGTQDFCWLVWRREHVGQPELRWLHRDGAGR